MMDTVALDAHMGAGSYLGGDAGVGVGAFGELQRAVRRSRCNVDEGVDVHVAVHDNVDVKVDVDSEVGVDSQVDVDSEVDVGREVDVGGDAMGLAARREAA